MSENVSNTTPETTSKKLALPAAIGNSIGSALSGVAATASVFTLVLALKLIHHKEK